MTQSTRKMIATGLLLLSPMAMSEGDSIKIQPQRAPSRGPQPPRLKRPYGAVMKNRAKKVTAASAIQAMTNQ